MKKVITVQEARSLFGKPKLYLVLNSAMRKIYNRLLPHEMTTFSKNDEELFEELLHELAHNIAVRRTSWNTPLHIGLGNYIRNHLGPLTQDGNEIDALAVSYVCAQYLGHPLSDEFIYNAVSTENLKFIRTKKLARQLVRAAMETEDVRSMSYALCTELLGEIHASTGT
jgi:hypothetical protein